MKKKLTALFLTLVMCMTLCVPALAVDTEEYLAAAAPALEAEEVCTNEFDYIVSVRNAPNAELQMLDISEEELSYINSGAIESELLYRATLSDEILREHYCYSDEAIKILREYDGSPLEENPQMRSVTATLTATLTSIVNTPTRTGLLYTWRWSTQPLNDFNDIAAITWLGTYENGGSNNMRLDTENSFANIQYFATAEDQQGVTLDVTTDQPYYGGWVEFPMGRYFGPYHWAKSGALYLYADLVNTKNGPELFELSARAKYAHYTLGANIGVDFSGNLSISFDGNYSVHGSKNLTVSP